MRNTERTLSTGDRVALALFILVGAFIAITSVCLATVRIVELTSQATIPVSVEFIDAPAIATADEESFPVVLDAGVVTVTGLPATGVVPGVLGQIAFAVTAAGLVAALITLSLRILRGTVFDRTNTRLVMGAAILALVGAAAARFFDNMLAGAAMAQVTEGSFDTAVLTVEPFPYLLGAFAAAIVGTVFVVGDRLQRDTEGLV